MRKIKGEPLVILLVEDNQDHAELVKRNLRNHRVANTIQHVSDGESAMDYLLNRKEYRNRKEFPQPHIILLDLRLPKLDGLEVLKEIKSRDNLKLIPAIILTTSDAEMDIAKAYEYHANSYLVKPVDFEKFTKLMNDFGFYWLGWNNNAYR